MAQFLNFKQDYSGLTDKDIEKQTEMYGLNIYTKNARHKEKFSYLDVILSPSVLLMLIAAVLCFFGMGIGAGIFAVIIDVLYCFAEIYFRTSSDKRLEELKESTTMKFRVIRNDSIALIEKEKIVPEDIIIVQSGERVPADALVLESRDLTCDERVFTGDSNPVKKNAAEESKKDFKANFVYSGTTVITGIAVCKVSATGVDTKLYQRKGDIPDRHPYYSGFERIVRRLVPVCALVGILLTIISIIARILNGDEIVSSALSGVTLGLCFIPTGIASIIRFYYTKGSNELLKNGAVVKSFGDIEKLNSLSVLCVEKKGAISKERLEVRGIYARSEELLYKVAALACGQNTTDPAERALMVKATFFDEKISNVYTENKFIEKLADTGDTISGELWDVGGDRIYCIKGSPEQILPMCRLSGEKLIAAQKRCQDYYDNGCTVLAFACVEADKGELDKTAGFSYTFVGFAAFSAPLRDSVSTAVKTCRKAGVRVVMLTEENPSVAVSTGKMIGISSNKVITGKEIEYLLENNSEIDCNADIYAKISPEQKIRIIEKLNKSGEVVAMTGTNSSDAETLEAANIGITISSHCVGSTYESADIVMNDDNFLSIAQMIACARQIHRNIKRAISLIISGYVGLLMIVIFNLCTSDKIMLNPPLIALVTMIMLPLLAIGYVSGKSDMKNGMPPSEFIVERKLNLHYIGESVILGLLSGLVAVASFALNNANFDNGRSCALMSYIFCTAAFAVIRQADETPFKVFMQSDLLTKTGVAVTLFLPIILCYIPFLNISFGLYPVNFLALLVSVLTGILPAVVYYFIKIILKYRQ